MQKNPPGAKQKETARSKKKEQRQRTSVVVSYLMASACIFAAAFILYGYSISFGYVLDDEMVITKNAFVQKGFEGVRDIFGNDSFLGYFQSKEQLYLLEGGRYRPLSLFTFAAEISWFGSDKPHISHFINIQLYALTGLLLFSVSKKMLLNIYNGDASLFAFIVSMIWIMHPVHTECISNIKGRDEILSLLFSLGSLWSVLKYHDTGKTGYMWMSPVMLLAGILAKESAITFVAVIPLSVFFFRKVQASQLIKVTGMLTVAALLFVFMRYQALGYFLDHGKAVKNLLNDPFMEMSAGSKYATILYCGGYYLKLLFFPHPLTHDYYPYHIPPMQWTDALVILSGTVYIFLIVAALRGISRKNFYSYCILFFLITISIVSNLIFSVGTFLNERFLYAPSIAFALASGYFLVFTLSRVLEKNLHKKVMTASCILVGLLFSYKTMARVPDWKDSFSLDKSALEVSENSARANCFYGVSLYKIYMQSKDTAYKKTLVDSMEKYFDKAIRIYPSYNSAWQMKAGIAGIHYQEDGDVNKLLTGLGNSMRHVADHKITRDFVKQYIRYIYRAHPAEAIRFCYSTGYETLFLRQKDTVHSLEFLQLGLEKSPDDTLLLRAMDAVKKGSGNLQTMP